MSTNEIETLYPEGKPITIGGQEFKIKPFVLKNRTKVIKIFTEIFNDLSSNGDIANTNKIEIVTKFISIAGDRIVEIYELILEKDRTWLEDNLTLKNEVALIQTVLEINDFPFLVSQVRSMMNQKNS